MFHAVNGAGLPTHRTTVSYRNPSRQECCVWNPRLLLGCSQPSPALSTSSLLLNHSGHPIDCVVSDLTRSLSSFHLPSQPRHPIVVRPLLCSRPGRLWYILVPPVPGCGILKKWISLYMPRFSCLHKKHHSPYSIPGRLMRSHMYA